MSRLNHAQLEVYHTMSHLHLLLRIRSQVSTPEKKEHYGVVAGWKIENDSHMLHGAGTFT